MITRPDFRTIKWGFCTHTLAPAIYDDECPLDLAPVEGAPPPHRNDVLVAEVEQIDHHRRIELHSGRSATLYPGDVVGVAFGQRYATRQYEGIIPEDLSTCHMLSVGGVCGRVVGKAPMMGEPTRLRPLGYVVDGAGERVNLRRYGRMPALAPKTTTVVVVGSSMDSGKTTAACAIVHGLARSGRRVCAGKITGTGSAKDILLMRDAGAYRTLAFTDIGHASTAGASYDELVNLADSIRSNLAVHSPDYVVLEIADGIVQRETHMLLEYFAKRGDVDHFVYCCCDTLGVPLGIDRLTRLGLRVTVVSGMVTVSPLAASEARLVTDVAVASIDELVRGAAGYFPERSASERGGNTVSAAAASRGAAV